LILVLTTLPSPAAEPDIELPDEGDAINALIDFGARLEFDDLGRVRRVNFAGMAAATDAQLEHVEGLEYLRELYLGGTQVTDEGLQRLSGLVGLRFLSLHQTRTTSKAIERLRDALPKLKVYHTPLDPTAAAAPLSREAPPMVTAPVVDPFRGELGMVGGRCIATGARGTWSPDGTRIALGKTPLNSGIQIVHVESGNTTELVDRGKDPAWSPGAGRWIAYACNVQQGAGKRQEIRLVEAVGGAPRRLADGAFPTWSADAKTVYFYSPSTRQIMSVLAEPPNSPPTVVWEVPLEDLPGEWSPAVAPDGRRVVLHGPDRLEIVDMETSETLHTLPLKGWRGMLAGWSADGRRLGFGGLGGEERDLWIFDLTTGKLRRLLSGWCTLPGWSADGTKLTVDFRSSIKGYEVWVIDLKRFGGAGG